MDRRNLLPTFVCFPPFKKVVTDLYIYVKFICAVYMKACVIYNKLFNVQQFPLLYVAVMLAVVATRLGYSVL